VTSVRQSVLPAISAILIGGALAHSGVRVEDTCILGALPLRDRGSEPQPASFSVAPDGRFLAFSSSARLLPADTNDRSDIYVFDFVTALLTIETMLPDGTPSNGDRVRPRISADGRSVVFESVGRLVSRTLGVTSQVLLRDRRLRTTRMLSVSRAEEPGNGYSGNAAISADGRVVAFESAATNLMTERDANGTGTDVYVVVLASGEVSRANVDEAGRQAAEGSSFSPAISDDGRFVAFTSSTSLDSNETAPSETPTRSAAARPRNLSVFVRDLQRHTIRRVGRRLDAGPANGSSYLPAISGDGRYVAFAWHASDWTSADEKDHPQVYLYDLETSATTLVSRSADGRVGNGPSTNPAVSRMGRFIAFQSEASDLVCAKGCPPSEADINLVSDVFLFDRDRGVMTRISTDADGGWMQRSGSPVLDGNADVIAFSSRAIPLMTVIAAVISICSSGVVVAAHGTR
jgi:Tol biopolymer transport system component